MGGLTLKLVFIVYYAILNIVGFLVMLSDKRKAMYNRTRTKESTLFLVSILGGALGVFLAMHIFRHKTKHGSFIYGIPAILIVHILLISYIAYNFPNLFK